MNHDPMMVKLYSCLDDQHVAVPSGLNQLELSRLLTLQVNLFMICDADGTYGPQKNRGNTALLLTLRPEIRELVPQEDALQFDRIVAAAILAWKASGQPDRTHNKTLIQSLENWQMLKEKGIDDVF